VTETASDSRGKVSRATRGRVLHAQPRPAVYLGVVSFVAAALAAGAARADVSSWLFAGGGVSQVWDSAANARRAPTLRLATGMGTDPSRAFVIGGLARLDTLFGNGSDLSAAIRIADYGYVNGKWGLALDLGGLARFWGPRDVMGATATLDVGGPWGLEIQVGGLLGNHDTQGMSVVLGVDLARLTVYRQSGNSWWKNTFPAVRPDRAE
jgi:hypothetical protein